MKFVFLILSVLLSTSCASVATSNDTDSSVGKPKELMLEKIESDNLNEALAFARENKDYRLLVTSGRSMSIPGLKSSDFQAMIALCGKKYSSGAGDVITSEEQRVERKKVITYMRQYNEKMLIICQENSIK